MTDESTLLARQLWNRRSDGAEVPSGGRESEWTLENRDWKHVSAQPRAAEGDHHGEG